MAETNFDAVAGSLNSKIGTLVVGSNSSDLSVPNNSFYSCSSVNITDGKWIVSYGISYDTAFSQTAQLRLVTDISNIGPTTIPGSLIRFSGDNGGGENGCILYEASGATTISLLAFQSSGSAKVVKANLYNISAIRISA